MDYLIENITVQLDHEHGYLEALKDDAIAHELPDEDVEELELLIEKVDNVLSDLGDLLHALDSYGTNIIDHVRNKLGHDIAEEQLALDLGLED